MAYENRDYTHLSGEEKQKIELIAQAIRNKAYGIDVRESIALAIEWVNREYKLTIENNILTLKEFENAKSKVSTLELDMDEFIQRYSEQIAGNTSLDETIDARVDATGVSHTTLKDRLDKENQEVTAQLAQIVINVDDYGAEGNANFYDETTGKFYSDEQLTNEATNDTASFVEAFGEANLKGARLLVPKGKNYYIDNVEIPVSTDVDCQGVIKGAATDSTPFFFIGKDKDSERINGTAIGSDLTAGTNVISGLSNYAGHGLVMESTEKLINRSDAGESFYTKNEPTKILKSGMLEKPLTLDYTDKTLLTLIIIPNDRHIRVNLNIETFGDLSTTAITNERSNSDIHLNLIHDGYNGVAGIKNQYAFNSHITGKIRGFENGGYGILNVKCYNLTISSDVTDNHSPIAGRHSRNMFIDGGSYKSTTGIVIDDHWGGDYEIKNALLTSGVNSYAVFGFAGIGDVTATNCEINLNNTEVFAVRQDTPYFDGTFSLEKSKINATSTHGVVKVYSQKYSGMTFDDNLVLKQPKISVKDIIINLKGKTNAQSRLYESVDPKDKTVYKNLEATSEVNIERVSFINASASDTFRVIEVKYMNESIKGDTRFNLDTIMNDSNQKTTVVIQMDNNSSILPPNNYELFFKNLTNVELFVDGFGLKDSTIMDSEVIRLYPSAPGNYTTGSLFDTLSGGTLFFEGCQLNCAGTNYLISDFEFNSSRFMPANMTLNTLNGVNASTWTIKSIRNCIFESGSINGSSTVNDLLNNNIYQDKNPRTLGYIQGAGSPVSSKTPLYIGQLYYDFSNKNFYMGVGATASDWKSLT